jgi:Ca2+-binding RTX toxin-like protein
VAGAIVEPPESECHPFAGAVGERIRLRLLRTAGSAVFQLEVFRPNGTRICHTTFHAADVPLDCGPLDADGTHHVLVQAQGAGTGEYLLSIQQLDGDHTSPQVTIRTPPEGAEYPRGATVVADYDCSDEAGGSGLATCVGTVADGAQIDTATLGAKDFKVIARDNAGNETSVTHTYTVIDDTPPTITLRTPPDGATYTRNQVVNADYECADDSGGSGLTSCEGTVADGAQIDTATFGVKDFTVTARDDAGNESSVTHQYRVTPSDFSAPRVEIRMPQAGAGYPRGAVVIADYECADEAGGSGLASCAGPVADGDPIDTATLGAKEFTVIARDNAGNQTSVGVGYLVVDITPPTITLRSPPDGAVYDLGQDVRADYECADESGGAGLASCAGPVADGDPIDTATAGPKSFTVTARDNAGNERSVTHRYTVSAPSRPVCDGMPATIVVSPDSGPVSGTPAADVIVGSAGGDIISGRGGTDRICGFGGADQLSGDSGNDRLFGGDGNDMLAGDSGNDAVLGGGGRDQLGGAGGEDDLRGGGGDDRLSGDGDHDELDGGGGQDVLLGRVGNDVLFGSGGHDQLRGGAGNDRALGERGNDELSGGRGNDRLFGGAGDDDIDGGPGRDFCRGGSGTDIETNCEV